MTALRAAVVIFLTATTVIAPADANQRWPALFDVTGVSSDDVLNIREAPDARSPIVGTLAPDAGGVELIRPNADESWAVVNTGEGHGWVSLAYLERADETPRTAGPAVRQCFGTEPFWSLVFTPPHITFTTPEVAPRQGLVSSFYASRSHPGRFAETGSLFPGLWGNRDIHLSIRLEACNDGMSDREYGIAVDMLLTRPDQAGDTSGTGLYSGCCSLTAPPSE